MSTYIATYQPSGRTSVDPLPVEESVTTEGDIKWAVKRIKNHRSRGPSGMPADHLKEWLVEARKEEAAAEKPAVTEGTVEVLGGTRGEEAKEERENTAVDMSNWEKVVALEREAFGEGLLAEEAMWQAVVIIPKGKGDYRGISLMEVMCKVVEEILNFRLTSSITYHDLLHRFRAGRGKGNSTLEAKLLHKLAALREEVLYVIFLDLYKAYGAL